jgi:hypothetical protein
MTAGLVAELTDIYLKDLDVGSPQRVQAARTEGFLERLLRRRRLIEDSQLLGGRG